MKKTKKNTMVLKIPKKCTLKIGKLLFIYNNLKNDEKGIYWQSPVSNVKVNKKDTDLICEFYNNKITSLVIDNKQPRVTIDVSIRELEKVLQKAKRTKKGKNKLKGFFKHLSPDVSFFFNE